jgi:hypothetical protein
MHVAMISAQGLTQDVDPSHAKNSTQVIANEKLPVNVFANILV